MRARYVGLFVLSAAALLYELALTRIFAVAQGYHFAFLSLSLALLGFGASGAWLAMRAMRPGAEARLDRLALATALAIVGSYLVLNRFPFDPYTIAWDPHQLLLLAVDYLALVVPFLLAGAAAGLCLSTWPELTPELYAANLAGSAAGSLAVLAALAAVGGSGTVFVAAALASLGALAFSLADGRGRSPLARCYPLPVLVALLAVAVGRPELVDVRLSPYKPLSYALHYPGSRIVYQRWNAYSRIDVVDSPGIRSAPGLSLRHAGLPPEQMGLTIDGGNLSPLTRSPTPAEEGFLSALQGALPHRLRPSGTVCLLDPRGGLDLLLALRLGAGTVDVVAPNPTVAQTVRDLYGGYTGHIYEDPRVQLGHPQLSGPAPRTLRSARLLPAPRLPPAGCRQLRPGRGLSLHAGGVRGGPAPPGARRAPRRAGLAAEPAGGDGAPDVAGGAGAGARRRHRSPPPRGGLPGLGADDHPGTAGGFLGVRPGPHPRVLHRAGL